MSQAGENQKIYFVRHGETEWNRDGIYQGQLDSKLTEHGIAQTSKVSRFLLGKSVERIFTSPLGRARASAAVIGKTLRIEPEIQGFLREQHFGDLQGRPKIEAQAKYEGFFDARGNEWQKLYDPYPGEGGESYFDVYQRIHDPFLEILAHLEGNAVFVGHESVNRMLRGFARGIEPHQMVDDRQANDEVVMLDLANMQEEVIQIQ